MKIKLRRRSILLRCLQIVLVSCVVIFIYYTMVSNLWNAISHSKWKNNVSFQTSIRKLNILLQSDHHTCAVAKEIGKNPPFTICQQTTSGQLLKDDSNMISIETCNFEIEKELSEDYRNMNFYIISGNPFDKKAFSNNPNMYFNTSWLQSLTWLPYIGHNIMFYLFKRFASLSALPHSSFKFGNQKNNLLSPWILEHLIDEAFFKNFHQLHIQIKLENEDSAFVEKWIRVVEKLFDKNFKPFRTKIHGDCDVDSNLEQPCIFAVSWIRQPKGRFPVAGRINPFDSNTNIEKEIKEILTTSTVSCNRTVVIPVSPASPEDKTHFAFLGASQWTVCTEKLQNSCTVYSAKFGGTDAFESAMAQLGCDVYLFDPTLEALEVKGPQQRIHVFNWGFSTINADVVSGFNNNSMPMWKYMKISDIVERLNHKNQVVEILRLDLHGGEWDVLHTLLTSSIVMNFKQIVVTMHMWHGEEHLNVVDRYIRLQKLLNLGFQVFHSEPLVDVTSEVEQECCHVIGWIKQS